MNLEEVAKLSGVSRSTVSRVVNNDPNVRTSTREHVLAVIKKVNFHPNATAQSLVAGRTRMLGLVIPMAIPTMFNDPYFLILAQGITEACNARDHTIMLWLSEPEYERRTIDKIVHGGMVDGVVVASTLMDDSLLHALLDNNFPFVLVGRAPWDDRISYVDVDNRAGSHEAVSHLLRLGRRRIATITGPQNMIAGSDRFAGYEAALEERDLALDPNLVADGLFTELGGYDAMRRLLPYAPDAVFIASDTMALGAFRALREAGVQVPSDIAVVSYDDMPFASQTDVPLTTVRQPIRRTGSVAADILMDRIEHDDPSVRRIVLPAELIIRDSCGFKAAAD